MKIDEYLESEYHQIYKQLADYIDNDREWFYRHYFLIQRIIQEANDPAEVFQRVDKMRRVTFDHVFLDGYASPPEIRQCNLCKLMVTDEMIMGIQKIPDCKVDYPDLPKVITVEKLYRCYKCDRIKRIIYGCNETQEGGSFFRRMFCEHDWHREDT